MEENKSMCCYLLKSRLSKKLPNLDKLDLANDGKIQKFLQYTKKIQEKNKREEQEKTSETILRLRWKFEQAFEVSSNQRRCPEQ